MSGSDRLSALKAARTRRGLKLRDVSERTGIAISYLSSLERNLNRVPSLNVARSLAKVYACTIDELFPTDERP